jgi:Skp family chaperone for outer membrane proteins
MMIDAVLTKLEMDLHAALNFFIIGMVATARAQLESALAEVNTKRVKELAEVSEQRTKVDTERAELQCEIDAMQTHKEQQEGHIQLNVGGYRNETSVQTLRRVPGNVFDAYFSGRYAQDVCTDGSIFVDRDGMLFGHVLGYMRDGVVSVVEQNELQRMRLLRLLKREFYFFSIEVQAEHGGGMSQASFDSLIIAAKSSLDAPENSEFADDNGEMKDAEDEVELNMSEKKEGGNGVKISERSRQATRRNTARRDVEGETPSSKWCTKCLADKKLDDFPLGTSYISGRQSMCRPCLSEKRRLAKSKKDERGNEIEKAAV